MFFALRDASVGVPHPDKWHILDVVDRRERGSTDERVFVNGDNRAYFTGQSTSDDGLVQDERWASAFFYADLGVGI